MNVQNFLGLTRGDTFPGLIFEVLVGDDPLDLTSAEIGAQFRFREPGGRLSKSLTIGQGITIHIAEEGKFQLDRFVLDLSPGIHYYDVQLIVHGDRLTIVRGFFHVFQDVTVMSNESLVRVKMQKGIFAGEQGTSVTETTIVDGELIVTLSSGEVLNAGAVPVASVNPLNLIDAENTLEIQGTFTGEAVPDLVRIERGSYRLTNGGAIGQFAIVGSDVSLTEQDQSMTIIIEGTNKVFGIFPAVSLLTGEPQDNFGRGLNVNQSQDPGNAANVRLLLTGYAGYNPGFIQPLI